MDKKSWECERLWMRKVEDVKGYDNKGWVSERLWIRKVENVKDYGWERFWMWNVMDKGCGGESLWREDCG